MLAALARNEGPPAPAPRPATCRIEVQDLPGPARSYHQLEVSGGYVRLGNDGTRIRIGVEPITVRLRGPRYTGELRLAAADCTGDRIVVMVAIPLPAIVVWLAAPSEMVVQCLDCAGELGRRPWVAEDLPPIPVEHGATHEFEIHAPGYRVLRRSVWLMPGMNRVELALEPV